MAQTGLEFYLPYLGLLSFEIIGEPPSLLPNYHFGMGCLDSFTTHAVSHEKNRAKEGFSPCSLHPPDTSSSKHPHSLLAQSLLSAVVHLCLLSIAGLSRAWLLSCNPSFRDPEMAGLCEFKASLENRPAWDMK